MCTLLLRALQVLTALQIKVAINDLWEWLLVGVVTMNTHIIDVEPERAVPTAVMEVSVTLCELRWYSGNSRSERECKAALFLTFACNNWGSS